MDRKIRDSKYVLMLCTAAYYARVMGEEKPSQGLGVRWEGNLVYQHLYNQGAENTRFIPVLFDSDDKGFIPTPLQGTTYYSLANDDGYERLHGRLLGRQRVEKPALGEIKPLVPKLVKTDPNAFLTGPIDVDLWNEARWCGIYVMCFDDKPPVLGLAFENEGAARRIFSAWHERYGDNDSFEELRISIIEGEIPEEDEGYSVHVGADVDGTAQRFKDAGFAFDFDLLVLISRIHRMNPPKDSQNLAMFKQAFRTFKTYFLAPGVIDKEKTKFKPILDLGIYKNKVLFRHVSDIGQDDLDRVVLRRGGEER